MTSRPRPIGSVFYYLDHPICKNICKTSERGFLQLDEVTLGKVYTKGWTGSNAFVEYFFHGTYFGDGGYPKHKQKRAENSLESGFYGYYYQYGHWKREYSSYFGQIIFDASCTHPAVVRTLKRFMLHEHMQDMKKHLYPNRPRRAAICDVSRDSRR
jgi:hypothetical protein